jgi:cytochrome oxidase Cu insertion factor (SCO1/SenC/PrrC family)
VTRWLGHPLFAPVLIVLALGWGGLVAAFLVVGPHAGGWATTVLTYCFGWNGLTRAYRIDTVVLATLEPPLFALVVAFFYGDDVRSFIRQRAGRIVGGGAAALFVTAVAALLLTGRVVVGATPAAAMPVRESRPAPRASLVDHRGQPFELGVALGRPVAVTFTYADCHASCPLLVSRLVAAASAVGDRALFVAVTLAPERDTPPALAAYAERWALPPGFHLLTGDPAAVDAVRAAWGVRAERLPDGEIGHDNVVVLVDGQGRVAFTLRGLGSVPDPLPALLLRLADER